MSVDESLVGISEVASRFRREGRPMRELVVESGFAPLRREFPVRQLTNYLRAHPTVIDDWIAYSEDKRTSAGWYLRPPNSVGVITLGPAPAREQHYVDIAAACAAFIIAELGSVLDGDGAKLGDGSANT